MYNVWKRFSFQIFLFNRLIQLNTPNPLNGQSLQSVTKCFCWFSLRCPVKHCFFFENLLTESCKSIFNVSAVNCHCHGGGFFICDCHFDESCFERDLKVIILALLCLFKFFSTFLKNWAFQSTLLLFLTKTSYYKNLYVFQN